MRVNYTKDLLHWIYSHMSYVACVNSAADSPPRASMWQYHHMKDSPSLPNSTGAYPHLPNCDKHPQHFVVIIIVFSSWSCQWNISSMECTCTICDIKFIMWYLIFCFFFIIISNKSYIFESKKIILFTHSVRIDLKKLFKRSIN